MKGSNFRQFAGEGLGQGAGRLGRSGWLRLGLLAALLILVLGGGGGPEPGPIELDRLSTWPGYGRGPAADVAVANGTAFVAVEQGGLLVVDVTSPSHPVRLGSYALAGQTHLVRVVGTRAYVATKTMVSHGGGCGVLERTRGRLVILDVSDPAKPAFLGQFTTAQEIKALCVDGERVYLSDALDGLHVVDVSDPSRPSPLSVRTPAESPFAVTLWADNGRLYSQNYGRVDVIDVSSPGSATLVTNFFYETSMSAGGICIANELLFVAEYMFGFSGEADRGCLSVWGPDGAGGWMLRGKLEMPSAALDVTVEGTKAYVAAGPDGIAVVDVTDPTRPSLVGKCDTPGMAVRAAVSGSSVCVADYHQGLQMVDALNPVGPSITAAFDTGLTTRKLRVSGDKAYLVGSDTHPSLLKGYEARSRLEIVEIKDPRQPRLLGTYDLAKLIVTMDVSDGRVCLGYNQFDRLLGEQEQRMQVLDVSTPVTPVCLGDTQVGNSAFNLALRMAGSLAFVSSGSDEGFQVFDISNPTNLVRLGQTNSLSPYEEVRVTNGLAYQGHDSGLDVYDVSHSGVPRPINSVWFEYSSNDDCDT